uniref:Uncharacterized protein n=1 Tax=Columba livia TaxID=8932 RepID=R7VUY1_COLLI
MGKRRVACSSHSSWGHSAHVILFSSPRPAWGHTEASSSRRGPHRVPPGNCPEPRPTHSAQVRTHFVPTPILSPGPREALRPVPSSSALVTPRVGHRGSPAAPLGTGIREELTRQVSQSPHTFSSR